VDCKHKYQRSRDKCFSVGFDWNICLRALDNELKAAGHNPGTTADLTVASLFAFELAQALRECRPPPE